MVHRILLTLIIAVVFVCCSTSKRVERNCTQSTVEQAESTESTHNETNLYVDTSRTQTGRVVITEIEFCHESAAADERLPPNSIKVTENGITDINGNIKRFRQTVIDSKDEQKGIVEDSEKQNEEKEQKENKSNAIASTDESKIDNVAVQDPRHNRWLYAAILGVLTAGVLLYLKRIPIIDWLKKILSGIRKVI